MAELIQIAQLQESRWEERLLNLWNYPKYTVTPGKKKKKKNNQKTKNNPKNNNKKTNKPPERQPTNQPEPLKGYLAITTESPREINLDIECKTIPKFKVKKIKM